LRFVVQRDPHAGLARDFAGAVEPIGPLVAIGQRLAFILGDVHDREMLDADRLRGREMTFPADQHRAGVNQRGGRAQARAIERGPKLFGRASEVAAVPLQLDLAEADRRDLFERAREIARQRRAQAAGLHTDPLQRRAGGSTQSGGGRGRRRCRRREQERSPGDHRVISPRLPRLPSSSSS
jgi:hypothetical protein